jgi:hypothetical protein
MSFGEGLAQGLNALANSIAQNRNAARLEKRQLDLLRAKQQMEEEASTRKDNRKLEVLNPLKILKGVKREQQELSPEELLDFNDLKTKETRKIDRKEAERLLALLNQQDELPASSIAQRDVLQNYVSGKPRYREIETPEYYTPQELLGYQDLGILGDLIKTQTSQTELENQLKRLDSDTSLPKEQKQAIRASILAGRGGASLGREFYINPNEEAGIAYKQRRTQDIAEDNALNASKQQAMEEYRARRLGQIDQGLGYQGERIAQGSEPTYSTSTNAEGETTTRIRQKGKPPTGGGQKSSNATKIKNSLEALLKKHGGK